MLLRFFFILIAFFYCLDTAYAAVTGQCSNCHTMHNSQNGSSMVSIGTVGNYAGWNGTNVMTGGSKNTPVENLLVSDCVGCHSSSTNSTIISFGNSRIPIVFNTSGPPENMLAGGNFYWVANTGDEYGHNVRGISAADGTLNSAPGGIAGCTGCHTSLTLTDAETDGGRTNGCRGCHQSVLHHAPQQAEGTVPVAINGWYRFLNAPTAHDLVGGGPVHGIEDPNWEQTPDKDTHNVYYGGTGNDNEDPQSMGKYCSGCHYNFHADGDNTNESFFGVDNGGNTATEVWFRHPADAVIPNSSEYTSYVEYDPLVPVGRQEKADIATVAMDVVRPGTDKVICVSCHRAHGSAYPDMLRWDYTGMETGTTGSTAGTGCFKCHSTKDGV